LVDRGPVLDTERMTIAPQPRVVVGVDGSANSRRALRRAAEEVRAHGATLEVVLAWNLLDEVTAPEFDPHYGEATARRDLEVIVSEELGDDHVEATLRIENDLPARVLLRAADGAWLVVVGSRGLGGFKGLLLGSVSQQIAHHAPCPVLIVPDEHRGQPG
jgi:nucleotide-binding universal stress UspA family protein